MDTLSAIATAYDVPASELGHLVGLYDKHGIIPLHQKFYALDQNGVIVAACPLTMQLLDAGVNPCRLVADGNDPRVYRQNLLLIEDVLGISPAEAHALADGFDSVAGTTDVYESDYFGSRGWGPDPQIRLQFRLGAAVRYATDQGVSA